MTYFLKSVSLIIFLFALPVHAWELERRPFTKTDKGMALAFLAAQAADYATTVDLINQGRAQEGNPLIRGASPEELLLYGLALDAGLFTLCWYLPDTERKIVLSVGTGIHGMTVIETGIKFYW